MAKQIATAQPSSPCGRLALCTTLLCCLATFAWCTVHEDGWAHRNILASLNSVVPVKLTGQPVAACARKPKGLSPIYNRSEWKCMQGAP